MESDPQFNTLRKDLLAVLDSDARIPFVSKQGDFYYNFWRDQNNERGLWRRTTLDQYKAIEPNWELILDLDALGKDENENWVWKGANLLRPDYKRALITLSRGGADADSLGTIGSEPTALKENRLRCYEDFAAVALDLYTRKVTQPDKLGIQGGSNGGLLVGNMVTLYPGLFKAAVCQVPLLDMQRYNKLLAGASWMAEYGDPDDPKQWNYIRSFSPYHNVKLGETYANVLFTTSTRDDRVHPGHARKMMAKMEEQGHSVMYYENIEGGHGGAANNRQSAFMQAIAYTFLKQQLFGE